MIQWLRACIAGLCFISVIPTFAQPSFNLQVVNNATQGQVVSSRMRVSGFTNIISAQFAICWDPAVLRFETVTHLNLPNLQDSIHFSRTRVNEGILGFAWPSPNIQTGSAVADNTAIFRLHFSVLGPNNTGTALQVCDRPPTGIEIGQVINGVISGIPNNTITFTNGFVAVGYTVSNKEAYNENMEVRVAPNPFSDVARVTFSLKSAAEVHWQITDPVGRIVLKNNDFFTPGEHGMEIASTQLHGAGAYFFSAEIAGKRVIRPFFLL